MIEDMTSRDPRNDQCGEQPGPTLDATAALAKVEVAIARLTEWSRVAVEESFIDCDALDAEDLRTLLASHADLKAFRDEATPALAQYVERINAADKTIAAQAEEIERLRAGDPLTNAVTHAHARAASAEAQIAAQAEIIESLSEALEEARRIVVRQAAVSLTAKDVLAIVDAALSNPARNADLLLGRED